MRKILFAAAAALSIGLSGSAWADTLNITSTPNGVSYTSTSITFTEPGSSGADTGIFSAFNGCTSCVTPETNFTSTTTTPFEVFGVVDWC